MPTSEEQERVKAHLTIIRTYLKDKFPHCQLTRDHSAPSICHQFIVTDRTSFRSYKLQVPWSQLSDSSHTPETTRLDLARDEVAVRMIATSGDYFLWEGKKTGPCCVSP